MSSGVTPLIHKWFLTDSAFVQIVHTKFRGSCLGTEAVINGSVKVLTNQRNVE